MLRKNKNTDISPRKEETGLAQTWRNPYDWFEEMDRWFDDLRQNFLNWDPSSLAPLSEETRLGVREPLLDLVENGREFVVRAELPGVAKDDVDVNVTPDEIEIKAESKREREEKEKGYYYRERSCSALQRRLPFPAEVLPGQAEASLKDGLLEVRVPKREPTPEKKPVKVRVD